MGKPAVINDSNWPTITALMDTFDEVIFNSEGLPVGRKLITLPVFGEVFVSYFEAEQHFKIYPTTASPSESDFYNGSLEWEPKGSNGKDLEKAVFMALSELVSSYRDDYDY